MLQWPKYGALRDTAEVLLAGAEETYAFIGKVKRHVVVLQACADLGKLLDR